MHTLSWSELEKRVSDAKAQIAPGSRWQHYKGGRYVVVDVVIIERTDEVGIMYRSLDHPTVIFMRPLVEWQDVVEHEGEKVFRFRSASSAL